jgi:hypothetical protein
MRLRLFACAFLIGKHQSVKRSRVPGTGIVQGAVQEQSRGEEGLSDFGSLAGVLAPGLRIEGGTRWQGGSFWREYRMDRAMLLLWILVSYTAFMIA